MSSNLQTAAGVSTALVERMRARVADPREVWGLPWGFAGLDEMTGGIHKEEMSVAMARPGVGKSYFMGQVALNVARYLLMKDGQARYPGHVVRLVLCEMSAEAFQDRMVCNLAHLQPRRVRSGHLSEEEQARYASVATALAKAPIEYLDSPRDFDHTARFIRDGAPCAWWAVDYIGIHQSKEPDPYRRVSALSQGFRQLAREVAPGLVLAQMNRAAEKREDKRPMLADLRDSGSIEQDASGVVIGLYRPDMHQRVEDQDRTLPRDAEMLVLKQRNGPIGAIPVTWIPEPPGWSDRINPQDLLGPVPE